MTTTLEESASSILQESLNLGDVFGSRYAEDTSNPLLLSPRRVPVPAAKQQNDNAEVQSEEESSSNQENEESDNDDTTKGRSVKTNQTSQTSQSNQTTANQTRRRRRVVSEGTQQRSQATGSQQQTRALGRRAVSLKASSQGGFHNNNSRQSSTDLEGSSLRKTPSVSRQRSRRMDPRSQNQSIASQSADKHQEKEKPLHRGLRRAASHAGDLQQQQQPSSPARSSRRLLVRKETTVPAASQHNDDSESKVSRKSRPSSRAASPRRCASPRRSRAASPRKHRNGSAGGGATDTIRSTKGRQTPTEHTASESSSRRDSGSMRAASPQVVVVDSNKDAPASAAPQFPASAPIVRPDNAGPQFPSSTNAVRPGVEGDDSDKDAENNMLVPYSGGVGGDSSSSDSSWNNSKNKNDGNVQDNQAPVVLQFDPTQADNVFVAKQVTNTSSDLHLKNKDGTKSVVNISGLADPLGSVFQSSTLAPVAGQPMFDFLGDQPDEEQQEHTESAEREAFDESLRLKEMGLPTQPQPLPISQPKPPAPAAPPTKPSSTQGLPEENPHRPSSPPKKRIVKGGGSKPRPVSRTLSTANVGGGGEGRTAPPIRRGIKGAKSMGPRLVSRRTHADAEGKGHPKKLVNDSKNYSQFFKDTSGGEGAESAPNREQGRRRTKPRPRQGSRAALGDDNGYSESEAEGAPKPTRRIRKRIPPGAERKPRKAAQKQDLNDSFAFSDTERVRKQRGPRCNNDSFALSDTEALHAKRQNGKPSGSFNASFNASFSSSPNQDQTTADSNLDIFARNDPLGNSTGASSSALFASNPEISTSPGNPLETSSSCLVPDVDADTDVPLTPTKGKKGGLAGSIGRYFGRKNARGGGPGDGDCSDADNSSVVSGGSRLFGNRRAKQHHLLLDGGSFSSMDDESLDFARPSVL